MQPDFDRQDRACPAQLDGFRWYPVFLAASCLLAVHCHGSAEQRRAGIHELQARPTERNLRQLRALLQDDDRDVRATALNALAECMPADAAQLALDALGDEDGFVRATAARLSGALGDSSHAAALAERLRQDAEPRVRQRAAESLALLGGEVAVQALLSGLEDPEEQVRLASVEGLRRLDPASATTVLLRKVVEDPAWEVRVQAARGLGEAADAEVVHQLEAALEDPNEHVRAAAGAALRNQRQRRNSGEFVRQESDPPQKQ